MVVSQMSNAQSDRVMVVGPKALSLMEGAEWLSLDLQGPVRAAVIADLVRASVTMGAGAVGCRKEALCGGWV